MDCHFQTVETKTIHIFKGQDDGWQRYAVQTVPGMACGGRIMALPQGSERTGGSTVGRENILDDEGASNGITGALKGGRGGPRAVL